jgi:hypothetical protein
MTLLRVTVNEIRGTIQPCRRLFLLSRPYRGFTARRQSDAGEEAAPTEPAAPSTVRLIVRTIVRNGV